MENEETNRDLEFDFDEIVEDIKENDPDSAYEKSSSEAEKLLKDPYKMERFLQKLERKMKTIPRVGDALSYVPVMISLVRSYMSKEYPEAPVVSIIAIVIALIYVFLPLDFLPDFLGPAGMLDDTAVVIGCLALVRTDIEDYIKWRKEKGLELEDLPDYDDILKSAEKNNDLINAFINGKKSAQKEDKQSR